MTMSDTTSQMIEVLQWPGIGPAKVRKLLTSLADKASVLDAAVSVFAVEAAARREASAKRAAIESRCADLHVQVVGIRDPSYPSLLKLIPDPPPVLYLRGNTEALTRRCVAVVGTRQASPAGLRSANVIASYLCRRGYTVVSGLALGIDTAAHEGALAVDGLTVAVLAHGLHTATPASNRGLADRILAANGLWISEHPPDVPPHRAEYVRRNRIQSGLSVASVVVETGETGGAIHQANFTKKQGRVLMTVLAATAESEDQLNQSGARHLIETLGAIGVRTTREVGVALDEQAMDPSSLSADQQGLFGRRQAESR